MEEVPEERIGEAEAAQGEPQHTHDGVSPEGDSLSRHLEDDHQLDAPGSLSATTETGLHDRLHGTRHADDD